MGELDQALILADAVIDVNDRRTDGQVGKVLYDGITVRAALLPAAFLNSALTIDLRFCDDRDFRLSRLCGK